MWVASLLSAEAAGPLVPSGELSLNLGSRAHDLVLSDDRDRAYVATDLGLSIVEYLISRAPPMHFPSYECRSLNLGGRSLGIAYKDYGTTRTCSWPPWGPISRSSSVTSPSAPVLVASKVHRR